MKWASGHPSIYRGMLEPSFRYMSDKVLKAAETILWSACLHDPFC